MSRDPFLPSCHATKNVLLQEPTDGWSSTVDRLETFVTGPSEWTLSTVRAWMSGSVDEYASFHATRKFDPFQATSGTVSFLLEPPTVRMSLSSTPSALTKRARTSMFPTGPRFS